MRDQEARYRIANLNQTVDTIHGQVDDLREAYDALFDFLAKEMGFQGQQAYYPLSLSKFTVSPRRFAKTSPEPEIIRTPKAKK